MIKGYVDDDYSVKSTYINIYDTTKKTLVAVTPTIYRDGTSEGVSGHAAREEGVNALYIALDDINLVAFIFFLSLQK